MCYKILMYHTSRVYVYMVLVQDFPSNTVTTTTTHHTLTSFPKHTVTCIEFHFSILPYSHRFLCSMKMATVRGCNMPLVCVPPTDDRLPWAILNPLCSRCKGKKEERRHNLFVLFLWERENVFFNQSSSLSLCRNQTGEVTTGDQNPRSYISFYVCV